MRPPGWQDGAEAYYQGLTQLCMADRLRCEMDILQLALTALDSTRPRSINVSMPLLISEAGRHTIEHAFLTRSLPPGAVTLELLEYDAVSIADAAVAVEVMAKLGAVIALDDFGRGHACLATLTALPVVDQVKFDASIVHGRRCDVVMPAMTQAIRAIGAITVAEHVDSAECHARMMAFGVDAFQGFYLGRPYPLSLIS